MHMPRLALVVALAGGALAAPGSNAVAATPRYASPTGTGTECTSAKPCTISEAVTNAVAGNEVVVNPGAYSLTATLTNPAPITIHGVAGQPRPRLLFSGNLFSGVQLSEGSTLRYVEIVQAATTAEALRSSEAMVDQVVVKGSSAGMCMALVGGSTIRDSLFITSGSGASAVCVSPSFGPSAGASEVRNVTAIATGSDGAAIMAYSSGPNKTTAHLVNVIAKGGPGGASLGLTTYTADADATITASHTNWVNYWTSGPNTHYLDGGGNEGAAPKFVNEAAGDYREAPGSVTIDAGVGDGINGAFDLDGDPRAIGTTDIGADERVIAPEASTGAASAVTGRSATLSGSVNPRGAPTTYRFQYGATPAYGRTTSVTAAGSGTSAVAAAATVADLSPGTLYHYRVIAANAGGSPEGSDRTFTTAAPPAPPPPSGGGAGGTAVPPPPFGGVELASPRLTYARGAIAVRLTCPAGTSDRCSGRTTLTARRSVGGRRVTLGRVDFAIAPGAGARVALRVTRAGRRLLRRVSRVRGRIVVVTRDGTGQFKITTAAVTIRRRSR